MSRFLAVFCSHLELVVRAYIIEQSRPVDLQKKKEEHSFNCRLFV